jgi:hypothetical protein
MPIAGSMFYISVFGRFCVLTLTFAMGKHRVFDIWDLIASLNYRHVIYRLFIVFDTCNQFDSKYCPAHFILTVLLLGMSSFERDEMLISRLSCRAHSLHPFAPIEGRTLWSVLHVCTFERFNAS